MNEGKNPERLLTDLIRQHLDAGLFTHCSIAAGRLKDRTDSIRLNLSTGDPGLEVYDLASLTKALVTTPLYFAAIDAGAPAGDRPLADWDPDHPALALPLLRGVTAGSLLAHRSGLPAWRNFWVNLAGPQGFPPLDGIGRGRLVADVLRRCDVRTRPDAGMVYSDVGFILLGLALEGFGGKPLDALFADFLAAEIPAIPAGGLCFRPGAGEACVPTARCELRDRLLQGEVHDENAAALGGVSGHAGLFGSAESVSELLRGFYRSPTGRILLEQNRIAAAGPDRWLQGWQNHFGFSALSGGIGHLGFTGTAFRVDAGGRRYGVLLTNRVISGRRSPVINDFRREAFRLMDQIVTA